jgi:hypothetical protein
MGCCLTSDAMLLNQLLVVLQYILSFHTSMYRTRDAFNIYQIPLQKQEPMFEDQSSQQVHLQINKENVIHQLWEYKWLDKFISIDTS